MLSEGQPELTNPEITLKPFCIFHIKEKGLKMYKKPWSWLSQRQHGGSLRWFCWMTLTSSLACLLSQNMSMALRLCRASGWHMVMVTHPLVAVGLFLWVANSFSLGVKSALFRKHYVMCCFWVFCISKIGRQVQCENFATSWLVFWGLFVLLCLLEIASLYRFTLTLFTWQIFV